MLNGHKVDALPLTSKSFPLPTFGRFPVLRDLAVGGAVKGGTLPIICGGNWGSTRYDECFTFNTKTHAWTESGKMSEKKCCQAASVHPTLGLVMTGGNDGKKNLNTVESTTDGKHFSSALPAMPIDNRHHCQVTVDSNTIMVFGGCTSRACTSQVALKLNIAQKKWKKLPKLPTGRFGPGCGVVKERGVPKRVVVSGGHIPGGGVARITTKVEVLELSTLKWTSGS